ncbi:MAG: response regulator [Methylococcaceae bacterium]|nr:response regulator [Methylococcaceae bacterium]
MIGLNKILYAEDEGDIREIATLALETFGDLETVTCESGVQVIDLALSFQPQLILLDVMMPGMDGPTTLKVLNSHKQLKSIPVIFLTAKILPDEIERFKSLGAIAVISKPFDPMTLADQIKQIWAEL